MFCNNQMNGFVNLPVYGVKTKKDICILTDVLFCYKNTSIFTGQYECMLRLA